MEEVIRVAISLGGDANTQAAIAGSVAETFAGGVPGYIETELRQVLPALLPRSSTGSGGFESLCHDLRSLIDWSRGLKPPPTPRR